MPEDFASIGIRHYAKTQGKCRYCDKVKYLVISYGGQKKKKMMCASCFDIWVNGEISYRYN